MKKTPTQIMKLESGKEQYDFESMMKILEKIDSDCLLVKYYQVKDDPEKLMLLICQKPDVVLLIKNPSDDQINQALDSEPKLIKHFPNVSDEIKMKIIKKHPRLIKHITDPNLDMIKVAISNDPHLIKNYPNLDEDTVIWLIEQQKSIWNKIETPRSQRMIAAYHNKYMVPFPSELCDSFIWKILGWTTSPLDVRAPGGCVRRYAEDLSIREYLWKPIIERFIKEHPSCQWTQQNSSNFYCPNNGRVINMLESALKWPYKRI